MAESDTAMNTSAGSSATASPKKAKAKAKKPRADPNRPKTAEMVTSAITNLKERGGSSLQAIKKHIAGHYKVDVEKLAPFIKKYLKTAVANGTLVQTKGKGASGSFKLGATNKEKKPKPAINAVKAKTVAKPKKIIRVAEKKVAKPKKPAEKKKPVAKPTKKVVEKKTPVKARKVKTPKKEKKAKAQKKPKSPKPKKAAKRSIKK